MKNIINILDDLTINKIAAGEVVERPSSALKELIENSIDAGANKISIDIIDGGKTLIKITDNGIGIPSSEVEKSFLRHATSKIKKIDDLYDLYSLGFRGEALASISAISKLEMITKTKDEMVGTKIFVEGGKIVSKEPIGSTNGTTIIIKEIFFNTPARQKFLKSTHAETINISDLINKLAIGNPNVQFKYTNNNKQMLNTPGDGKLINTIRSIYGKEITENLINIEFKCNHFKIDGYIGNNNIYRSNKNLQHIYINKRFVKSKIIIDAITESYKSIIPIGKHAVCFLNIEVEPACIDVNIHPNKLEVKFEKEQEVYIELRDFLKVKLIHSNLIGKYATYNDKKTQPRIAINNREKSIDYEFKNNNFVEANSKNNNTTKEKDEFIEVVSLSSEKLIDEFPSVSEVLNANIENELKNTGYLGEEVVNDNIQEEFQVDGPKQIDSSKNEDSHYLEKSIKDSEEEYLTNSKRKFSLYGYSVIGVVFNTYIILSKDDSMYLLDQHAAHERVLYERYMDKFYRQDINMQILLDPVILEVSNVDMLQIENNLELFMKFGFELEVFGNNHVMIRCVPTIFGIPETEKFILQIIDNIDEITSNYDLKGERFASMACRSAIKANDKIYDIEIKSLLEQLENCENPFTCPHGRPIMVEISKTEIEKMFKRIM
ncbi:MULTISPECIES: DNA mismatch repair endonuclease MutL [unclassified Clostridioides]|uniref:DNA mismatch repair endonuclease MutL n=1 Tax=unclassified Clostridioides TaxID=2635829 RepID=UPI001D12ACFF|nr:DNA mismatch repair endonuclease MutL [Clostridioides sp. ZZV14-6153]MCC0718966.1 DNA mismatch repair endonuclease MutL [Clostridioides sp. ZZV14-6105]MCC0728646.1 DNA mismatch repair endonuclease MutL [Clostridioides sp. ZZV14-6045]MCC0730151.1 DNA mismatch repair endonuclease MutL [Clostridioides sp. ZZV14-6048]MCC0734534.1 DNA mismatch repair endonuclease MutL [Clostridioides sp. ZZV14-6009]